MTELKETRLSLHEPYYVTSIEQLDLLKAETCNCSTALQLWSSLSTDSCTADALSSPAF